MKQKKTEKYTFVLFCSLYFCLDVKLQVLVR